MDKKKIDIISILAIMALFAILYSTLLKDDFSTYSTLRHKRTSLKDTISKDTASIGREKDKVASISNLEREIKENKLLLLKEERIPYFLNYVASLAHRHKVGIVSIEPGETIEDDLFTKTVFTAEIRGGFPDMYNFLYHLEDDWRGVKVEALSINKNPDDSSINIRLTLVILSMDGYREKA